LKKYLLLAGLAVLMTPFNLKAEDHDRDDRPKHHIRATDMAGMGLGAAALVGAVGYLVLRQRNSKRN
jgi:hypothetical protein